MAAYPVAIRDGVYNKIDASITAQSYSIIPATVSNIGLEKTYFPQENIEDVAGKPYIKIVAMALGSDRNREYRNQEVVLLSVAVQIALQQKVNHQDTPYIDKLLLLIDEIMTDVEDDELVSGDTFKWQRTEPLRDENGLLYSYEQLETQGVFQSIFTCFYQKIKES